MKWWVRQQKARNADFRMKSFMTEMVLAHLSDSGVSMADYPTAFEKIFAYIVRSKLKTRISFADYYPASKLPGPYRQAPSRFSTRSTRRNNVATVYDDGHRQRIVAAAQEALEAIAQARFATTKGHAIECWQEILGTSFRG
ncbi:MAG: hypothetical protein WDO13_08295 [Verrucomicrobiota bacterium]